MTMTIQLADLQFFAHHGLYAEEQVLGNDFVVNLTVRYQADAAIVEHIDQTVNYEQLFKLVQARMQQPTALLETLAGLLVADIRKVFPGLSSGELSIRKRRPPVQGWQGDVVVSLSW